MPKVLKDKSSFTCANAFAMGQCLKQRWREDLCPETCNRYAPMPGHVPVPPIGPSQALQSTLSTNETVRQQLAPVRADEVRVDWWREATPGYCDRVQHYGLAASIGDCEAGARGSWPLRAGYNSSAAADACLKHCLGCGRCRYISWSAEERLCTWVHDCDLDNLFSRPDTFATFGVRTLHALSPLPLLRPLAISAFGGEPSHRFLLGVDTPCSHEYAGPCGSVAGAAARNASCNPFFRAIGAAAALQVARRSSKSIDVWQAQQHLFAPVASLGRRIRRPHQTGGAAVSLMRLVVSPHHRLAYCPIEKAGESRFIRLILRAFTGKTEADSFGFFHTAMNEGRLPGMPALSLPTQMQLIACPDWIKVVVVRDPLERLLSRRGTWTSAAGDPPQHATCSTRHAKLSRAPVACTSSDSQKPSAGRRRT